MPVVLLGIVNWHCSCRKLPEHCRNSTLQMQKNETMFAVFINHHQTK